MSYIGCALAFLLVCLACADHGRRSQTSESSTLEPAQVLDSPGALRALATFLLAIKPEAGWKLPPAVGRPASDEAAPATHYGSRRKFMHGAAIGVFLPGAAHAFENSLPYPGNQGTRLPTKPGPQPTDIGIRKETGKLKPCMDTKPHCFSTSSIREFDEMAYDEEVGDPGLMKPWKFTKGGEEAMADVVAAVKSYPPGQEGIDGGGWKIIKTQPNYVYVQFESLLKGFIDDMELAILDDGELSLRSSSRVGRQDKLVNSKRINYFAQALGAVPGWTTKPVTKETNPIYFNENTVSQSRLDDMRKKRGDMYSSDEGMKSY